eukprot:CAMPEP_0206134452 /NCGR_PEP_ID=MMETSP1473-20131121/14_1 /ASSEMBLY_ACC=CAM_ASM_001109 /TAXON_ID=1461547 /ORGANISM="Stichococcus sp, Strain RCC1054" /LENGTH=229 /DNA_ID=CAMNT_0053526059 /DNA_START=199 /DNA_END=888 /DNA_ORIENTATION=-
MAASLGRCSSGSRARAGVPTLSHVRLLASRPSRQQQQQQARRQQRSSPARAASCRPNAFMGGPWGAMGPMGFGCGTVRPEDWNRMAQEFEKAWKTGAAMNFSSCQDVQMPMATDVAETRDAFVFTADLPGVQKQNTKVQANKKDRMLTITGERAAPEVAEEEKSMRRRRERRFGKFSRTFQLPEDANLDSIKASFKDGVLTVRVGRVVPTEPPVVDIPVDDWLNGGNSA